MNGNKIYFLWHQAWPHNDLLLLKTKEQLLHHTYLWPPILWHSKAMDKGKIEIMATKICYKFLCLKSIENFVGMAWLIWMSHSFLKNLPDIYETPCRFLTARMLSFTVQRIVFIKVDLMFPYLLSRFQEFDNEKNINKDFGHNILEVPIVMLNSFN